MSTRICQILSPRLLLALLGLLFCSGTVDASVGEKKALVCPIQFLKSVPAGGKVDIPTPNEIREYYQKYWEGYWRENSYGKFTFPTKTFQYVFMPWSKVPRTNADTSPKKYSKPCAPLSLADSDSNGEEVWTPGERFLDLNNDGKWSNFEVFWDTKNVLKPSKPPAELGQFNGFPDNYGEVFLDMNQDGAYENLVEIEIYSRDMDLADGQEDGRHYKIPANLTIEVDEANPYKSLSAFVQSGNTTGILEASGNIWYMSNSLKAHFFTTGNALLSWDPKKDGTHNGDFDRQKVEPGLTANDIIKTLIPSDNILNLDDNSKYTPMPAEFGITFKKAMLNGTDAFSFEVVKVPCIAVSEQFADADKDGKWTDREPFEDYLVRWDYSVSPGGAWVACTNEYIRNNYPGDCEALIKRIGNGIYDKADAFKYGVPGTKMKASKADDSDISIYLPNWDPPRGSEQVRQFGGSFDQWWTETFNTSSPGAPGGKQIIVADYDTTDQPGFGAGGKGWPIIKSLKANPAVDDALESLFSEEFDKKIVPMPGKAQPLIGTFTGNCEYRDMPSSMYHSAGDGRIGEETDPVSASIYGRDYGDNIGGPFPDFKIPCSGPWAYHIHGDSGWDAGDQVAIEFLTWRTDGAHFTDSANLMGYHTGKFTNVGDIQPRRCRDNNLDGLIDQGLPPPAGFCNYVFDLDPTTIDDGSQTAYPYHRSRICEDVIEAIDDIEDFDSFGTGINRSVVDYLIPIFPDGYIGRNFQGLSGMGWHCYTKDSVEPVRGSGQVGCMGEGVLYSRVAAHESGHDFQGWPDLYDKDTFNGHFVNTPIGGYDLMSVPNNFVHSEPWMKVQAGWTTTQDLRKILVPGVPQTLDLWPIENNEKQYYTFGRNDPVTGNLEQFWFWYESGVSELFSKDFLKVDKSPTGKVGLLIAHSEVGSDAAGEDRPLEQRLGDHFAYEMVQADGLNEMQDAVNTGNPGDPFPGSTKRTKFNAETNPPATWWDKTDSGLEILNLVEPDDQVAPMKVTFLYKDYTVPNVTIIAPPGGKSDANSYQVKYEWYDSFGGTDVFFFRDTDSSGYDGKPEIGFGGNVQKKAPGKVLGTFDSNVVAEPDGKYYFYALAVPGQGEEGRPELLFSAPAAGFYNWGNGTLSANILSIPTMIPPVITTATSTQQTWSMVKDESGDTWTVTGSVTGDEPQKAITGMRFYTTKPFTGLSFTIYPGTIGFRKGDIFTFRTAGLTTYSAPVEIVNHSVPVPPPTPLIMVTKVTGNTYESDVKNARTVSFDIYLSQAPTSEVVMDLSSSDTTEGSILSPNPAKVTFTTANWATHQTVTVRGVDDKDLDGNVSYEILISTAVSNDPVYNGENPADVQLLNIDDEEKQTSDLVKVSAISDSIRESSGKGTFTVVLTQYPSYDVVIRFSSSDPGEATVSPSFATFTQMNYSVPQTITVTGVPDGMKDGDQNVKILISKVESYDRNFDGISVQPVDTVIVDADTASVPTSTGGGNTIISTPPPTTITGTTPTGRSSIPFSYADGPNAIAGASGGGCLVK